VTSGSPGSSVRSRFLRSLSATKPVFQRLYEQFDRNTSVEDPVNLVRRYDKAADREVAGFCAAALSFGRVRSVLTSIEALLAVMGSSPANFVSQFNPSRDGPTIQTLRHRWISGADLVALIAIIQKMIMTEGSIEKFFLRGYRDDADDIGDALDSFCVRALAVSTGTDADGIGYFFPRPTKGSACKRLNLYLRWMVRRDHIDFGLWQRVSATKLIVPLDTHVIRVSQCLRLTRYKSPGWAMAREITAALRQIDAEDPVKYDFSLCHIGMQDICGFNRPQLDTRCPLRGVCQPGARRPRVSQQPSFQR